MKRILIPSIICAALAGCTENAPQAADENSLKVECYARSTSGGNVIVKDFGMYVMNGSSSYEGVNNPVHVTYGTSWQYPEIWLDREATIYAFYPYQSTSDITNIPLSLSPQTDYLATTSAILASRSNPSIHIILDHLLAKIQIRIDGSKDLTYTITNIETSGTYNLSGNNLSVSTPGTVTSSGSEALIFPAREKSLSMSISYNGKSYNYVAPSKTYESGKEYTYNLKINDSKELVIVGEVEVNPWQVGGNYEGTVRE